MMEIKRKGHVAVPFSVAEIDCPEAKPDRLGSQK